MNRLVAVHLLVAALAAGPLTAAPAAADPTEGPGLLPWNTVACATGRITAQPVPGRYVWISGWIERCADTPVPDNAQWAMVSFYPDAGVPGAGQDYAGPGRRVQVLGRLDARGDSPPSAVCLAFRPTGLLSCVSIDAGDSPDLVAVAPIGTDHPRVTMPVQDVLRPLFMFGTDYCGNCV